MRRDPQGKVMAHKGLNTLLQCTGSVIVKATDCYLRHHARNLDTRQLIVYHDEVQAEVNPKHVERYSQMCYNSIKQVEKRFNFRCPLSIEVSCGSSWREVH